MRKTTWILIAFLGISTSVRADATDIDNDRLERMLARGVPLVDIRTPEEQRRTGVVEGSRMATFVDPQGRFDPQAWLSAIRKVAAADEPIMLICHSGGRSAAAKRILGKQFGYQRVYNVRSGIARWIAEGRPTVPQP